MAVGRPENILPPASNLWWQSRSSRSAIADKPHCNVGNLW